MVAAVEQLQRLACAHAQHAANVVRGVFIKSDFTPDDQRLGVIDAGNSHGHFPVNGLAASRGKPCINNCPVV